MRRRLLSISAAFAVVMVTLMGVPTPAHATGWTTVLSEDYETGTTYDGNVWTAYDGPYGSEPLNCARPDQNFVADGMLQIRMSYRSDLSTCGGGVKNGVTWPATKWYSGGLSLKTAYRAVNQRVSLELRELLTDPAALANPTTGVRSFKNVPMHMGDATCWPTSGEINWLEGTNPTTLNTNIHYSSTNTCGQENKYFSSNYSVDFRNFHTVVVERNNYTATVWIDGTQVYTKIGTSTSFPDVIQRLILQQECKASGCPASTSPTTDYNSTVQIKWLTVENYES